TTCRHWTRPTAANPIRGFRTRTSSLISLVLGCEVTFARFFPAASPYSANPPADSAAPQVSLFRAIHGCGLLGEDTVDALGVVLRLIRVLLRSHRYEIADHFAQLGLHPHGRARGCGPLGLPVEQGGAMLVYALVHGSLEAAVLVRMAAGP